MPNFNILIIGAGIAGISTAISLRRSGHSITVLERHPDCQAIGGPVGLSANATRVLIEYGLRDIMEARNSRGDNVIYQRRYHDGKVLGSRTNDQTVNTYGYPGWSMARCRLQETLVEIAQERGVKILFNTSIERLDAEKPAVHLKDGSIHEADLIIGADGIRSIVRDNILENRIQPTVAFTAINVDVPRSLLAESPTLATLLTESNFWLGPSRIAIALNTPDHNDSLNICLVSEDSEGEEGNWHALGNLEKVKAKFADFEPRIASLLDLAKPQDCYMWRFSDMPPLERWSSSSGKVVLVGDAAHAMLPYTNQGASQCIEDSASLSLCLSHAVSPSDFPIVLSAFEAIRKPRVEWLIKRGHENARLWHLPDGPEQQQRDRFLGSKPLGIVAKDVWDGENVDEPPVGQWNPLAAAYIQGFDIIGYTERRLDTILG